MLIILVWTDDSHRENDLRMSVIMCDIVALDCGIIHKYKTQEG